MRRAIIQGAKCQNCAECKVMALCEFHSIIREEPEDKPWIDFYKCAGCLKCKNYCPNGAIEEMIQPCDGKRKGSW